MDRIGEAQREGWTGEAQGLQVSLAAASQKLAQMDQIAARRATVTHLGMPAIPSPSAAPSLLSPPFRPLTLNTVRPGKTLIIFSLDHL